MKSVFVTLSVDIPDTEVKKPAKVTVEGREYDGVIQAIVVHEMAQAGEVTLKAVGLGVVPT